MRIWGVAAEVRPDGLSEATDEGFGTESSAGTELIGRVLSHILDRASYVP